ncbi:MAG: DNA mismatch repair protein MutS, partial [Syntrophomonadaceae bacterium]|nr:DNA mismatch repair protein MutS [Syntrophomonadaceae bacterium]
MSGNTPMIEQYLKIKKEYADCILFFRLGDFYEMFFEDAETASRELDIVLTARDGGKSKVPMCGVPYHAYANYVGKLLDKGYRVAICEQVEDPREAKGIVAREVIRVITPGTALDDAWLTEDNNYLAAIVVNGDKAGLAYVDVLTGEFKACQLTGLRALSQLRDELARLRPAECLIPRWSSQELSDIVGDDLPGTLLTEVKPELFLQSNAWEKLNWYLGSRPELCRELEIKEELASAAGALIGFIEETQRMMMNHLCGLSIYQSSDYLGLDRASRQNLELISNLRDGKREGSLLGQLDYTCTAMGCRRIRVWLEQPLIDITAIENRLEAVAEFLGNRLLRQELKKQLKNVR